MTYIMKNDSNQYLSFQVFVSKSYDATSHFETTCDDVLELFRKITGAPFDFSQIKQEQIDE